MHSSRPYLTTLTPLRGIAALIVVLFHCNLMLMPFMPISQPHFITAGWMWVDFFFVLSGFIISYVYADKFTDAVSAKNYWSYIKARFARVYPLHLITLVWCLICAVTIIYYAKDIHPFFGTIFNPSSAVASLFLTQALGLYSAAPLNTPSWSLSTEWWMYMVFPMLAGYFHRIKALGKILTLLGIACLFLFIKYYLGPDNFLFPGGTPSLNVVADFGIFRCMAGFLLGMFLFTLYKDSFALKILRQSWVFVVSFFFAFIAMHFGAEDILVIAAFPPIILSAAYNTSTVKKILEARFLQRLGDWSFSIYMVHVPIIYVLWINMTIKDPNIWAKFPPGADVPPDYELGGILCAVVVVSTLLLACASYRFVEVPSRNFLNSRFNRERTKAAKILVNENAPRE